MRAGTSALGFGVVLAAAAVVSAQGANPRIGTWHLNVAKSTYSPGPAPKTVSVYTANYAGKRYPLTGSATAAR